MCAVTCGNIIYAQKISTKDAIIDFEYLNEAVVNAHGANYHYNAPVNLDSLLSVVHQLKSDSISIPDFRYYLGVAFREIGCLHTSVKEFPLDAELPAERFFPIPVLLVNNALYIDNHKIKASQKYVGQKIEEINGYSAAYIVDRLLNYLGGDGRNSHDPYAEEIASLYAPKLISYYLNQPLKFRIKTGVGTFSVSSSAKPSYRYRTIVPMEKQEKILEGERAYYLKRDSIPVLRIEKFMKEDMSFWRLVFGTLSADNSPYFIIDLRGNTGGNRKTGAELMRYLAADEFGYDILQPKNKPKPYLNKQGKRYYRFSKWKYNVGKFSHKKNTDLGKSFHFNFKPHKSTYQGQIILLTDGLTASTSTMLTTWLDKHSNAKFIGRTAGGGYNGNNGGVFPKITLPFSKTVIRFPSYRIVLDNDYKKEDGLKPDIEVNYSVEDWLANKDRDWEAVLDFIRKNE
ncbi:MAG: hypothetical protein ACI8ZM_000580 [Crocinitomix sp.]|jgi:hypothetical protein